MPLGDPYTVTAIHLENGEANVTGITLNQGDLARVNIEIISNAKNLDAIDVVGSGIKNSKKYLGAATAFSSRDIKLLPVNGRNFTSLTDLSPLARGSSISGQLGSSTNFTIDGMNAKNPTSAGATTSRS